MTGHVAPEYPARCVTSGCRNIIGATWKRFGCTLRTGCGCTTTNAQTWPWAGSHPSSGWPWPLESTSQPGVFRGDYQSTSQSGAFRGDYLGPGVQGLGRTANFGGNRLYGRPLRRVLTAVLLNHAHGALAHLGGGNLGDFLIMAPFSSEGASSKPRPVQGCDTTLCQLPILPIEMQTLP